MADEYEEKIRKLSDVRMLFLTSIVSALALVVGLFWNDAIKATIEQIVPAGEGLSYKFLAAIIVTIAVVVIIYILIHSQKLAVKRLTELKEKKRRKAQPRTEAAKG